MLWELYEVLSRQWLQWDEWNAPLGVESVYGNMSIEKSRFLYRVAQNKDTETVFWDTFDTKYHESYY